MSLVRIMMEGFRRILGSPKILAWLWAVNLALALPAAWALTESIHSSVSTSIVSEDLRDGFDMTWYGDYEAVARGLERSFAPSVVGAGAFYANLEAWIAGELFEGVPIVVGLGVFHAFVWALFLGGAVDRFARPLGGFRFSRFIRSGARYFFRFLRLAVLSSSLYYLVYRIAGWVAGWTAGWLRDVTSERTVLTVTVALAAGTVALLALVHMVFAFAKIATVTEDRRSMLLAALRGAGFVASHPGRVLGLYLAFAAVSAALLAAYAWVAPGADQSGWTSVILAFAGSQLFLVVRIGVALSLLGGQVALYQSRSTY